MSGKANAKRNSAKGRHRYKVYGEKPSEEERRSSWRNIQPQSEAYHAAIGVSMTAKRWRRAAMAGKAASASWRKKTLKLSVKRHPAKAATKLEEEEESIDEEEEKQRRRWHLSWAESGEIIFNESLERK